MTTWDLLPLYPLDTASLRPRPPLVRQHRFPNPPSPSSPSSPDDDDESGSSSTDSPGLHTPPAVFNSFLHHHHRQQHAQPQHPHYDPFAPEHCLFDFDFRLQSNSWGHIDHSQPPPTPAIPVPVPVDIPSSTTAVGMPDSHPLPTRSSTASSLPDSPTTTSAPTTPSTTKSSTAKKTRTCMSTKDFVPPDVSGLSKREARLVKNRAAAFLSRQRKREEFECMEVRVAELEQENARLRALVDASPNSEIDTDSDLNLHQPTQSTPRPTKKRARASVDDESSSDSSSSSSSSSSSTDQIRDLRASVAKLRAQLVQSTTRQRELEEALASIQLDGSANVKAEQSESALESSLAKHDQVKGDDDDEQQQLLPSGHVKSGAMSLLVLLCALPSLLAESSSSSSSTTNSSSSSSSSAGVHDPSSSLDPYPYPSSFSFPTSFGMNVLGSSVHPGEHHVQIDHSSELGFGPLDLGMGMSMGMGMGMGMGIGLGDWMGCQPDAQQHQQQLQQQHDSEWTRLRFVHEEEDSSMQVDSSVPNPSSSSPLSALSSLDVEFETARVGRQVVVRLRKAGKNNNDNHFISPESSTSPSPSIPSPSTSTLSTPPFNGLSLSSLSLSSLPLDHHTHTHTHHHHSSSSSASLASLAPISPITPLTIHHPQSLGGMDEAKSSTTKRVRISLRNLGGLEDGNGAVGGAGAGGEWEVVEI